MKLRYTRKAASELDAVLGHIAGLSPQGEQSVAGRIRDTIELLQQFPNAGQLTSKRRLRRIVVTPYPYMIFYRVSDDGITIHSVRQSARRPSSMPT